MCTTTLDFENDTRIDEIIDVEANEKRRREQVLRRRVKPRLKNTLHRASIPPVLLPTIVQDTAMQDAQDDQYSNTSEASNSPSREYLSQIMLLPRTILNLCLLLSTVIILEPSMYVLQGVSKSLSMDDSKYTFSLIIGMKSI